MGLLVSFAAWFLFLIWHFMSPENAAAQPVSLYISNKCPFPIWPATAPNAGHPVIADGGFSLPSGQTRRIYAPPTWSGRLWARTGCKFNSNWQPACQTGDCDGRFACNGTIGLPPATLLQVLSNNMEVVACKSACLAFNLDMFCCRNEYGTPEKCKPSVYSKMFKGACPSYYSYAFDTPAPLVNCPSKEYIITFCPSNWGDEHMGI
ncbi:unnamed protein product, partial [Vitis vinifera]